MRAPRGRRTGVAVALVAAVCVNAVFAGLLVVLNRRPAQAVPPPRRLTWVALNAPPPPAKLALRPRPRKPEPPRRRKVEPKIERPVARARRIEPRMRSPRLAPAFDVHPELSTATLKLAVSVPGLGGPGLLDEGAAYALDWSFDEPAVADAPQEEPAPEPAPTPEPPARAEPPAAVRSPDRAPQPVYAPPPQYPAGALRREAEGHVVLQMRIDAEGRVAEVKLVSSQGDASFARAAARAVARWRFRPAVRDGKPVAVWATKKITFSLRN